MQLVKLVKRGQLTKERYNEEEKRLKGKKNSSKFGLSARLYTGAEKINTAGEVNAASIEVNTASKVNTCLAEALRMDSLQKRKREAEQIHLDALLAQRIAEEEELDWCIQKKRKSSSTI
ncbi:hypothetical protein Tco_0000121 [Tanacetum coccineum]